MIIFDIHDPFIAKYKKMEKRGDHLVEKIKDEVLQKLSGLLYEQPDKILQPVNNATKLNCWTCGKYYESAEECYDCMDCNIWTLKKIFLHNKRFLRYLDLDQLHLMGFSGI
jgi:hypothetical protein